MDNRLMVAEEDLQRLARGGDWKGFGEAVRAAPPDQMFRAKLMGVGGKIRQVERPDAEGNPMPVLQRRAHISTETWDFYDTMIERQAILDALPTYLEHGAVRAMHSEAEPIGRVYPEDVKVDKKGALAWLSIPMDEETHIRRMKNGLYRGVSIGFGNATYVPVYDKRDVTKEPERDENGWLPEPVGYRITKLDLIELSPVDAPATKGTGFRGKVKSLLGIGETRAEGDGRPGPNTETPEEGSTEEDVMDLSKESIETLARAMKGAVTDGLAERDKAQEARDAKAAEEAAAEAAKAKAKAAAEKDPVEGLRAEIAELTALVEAGTKANADLTATVAKLSERSLGSAQTSDAEIDARAQRIAREMAAESAPKDGEPPKGLDYSKVFRSGPPPSGRGGAR